MFFLLRMAFWLAVVFMLLPGLSGTSLTSSKGTGQQQEAGARVDPMEALGAASSAMADAGGFCARQPQACEVGGGIIQMLGERAEAGARIALGYITEQILDQKRRAAERANGNSSGDTLTTHDLSPEWQGTGPAPAGNAAPVQATGQNAPAQPTATQTPAPHVPLPPKRPA
jgi:hypothetical protein